jgi:hypothetical protein
VSSSALPAFSDRWIRLVAYKLAIGKEQQALCILFRESTLMRHQQDGHAQAPITVADEVHDFPSGVAVEISCWFIGE